MERSSSEERMTANSKPIKSALFGLWTKRSTKIEPHPVLNETNLIGASLAKDQNHDMSFARCSPQKLSTANNNYKRQYDNDISVISSNTLNSYNSSSDKDRPSSRNKTYTNNDDCNNLNINGNNSFSKNSRFSTQFSLCCKVDRKPLNTPVRVRYKSALQEHSALRRHHLSMNLETKPAPIAHTSECNSAPETPVVEKSPSFNSHSSPSTNSTKSTHSDNHGQPRTIAVTASRSRLRLKLLPPDKPIVNQPVLLDNDEKIMIKETQHMSSPNISTNPEYPLELCAASNSRSMSHEGIQTINRPKQLGSDVATQALMAAQVLSLIPTEKARERSYLDGRLGSSSLLGASELIKILPRKEITIFIGTWNMNGQSPPKQMNDFVLPAALKHVPDLVAIGTQESCPERFEWEVTLQETLGPSHVLFHSTTLGTLHLAIYLRRDLIWYCSSPEDASMSVRPGTAFRTKGAVAISFSLFGTTMLFVTSHLTAHQQKVKERVQDVKRITHALDLPKNLNMRHKNKDVTQNFDNVFWCGDLNFRLGEPREKLLEWIKTTKFPLPSHLPHGYMHTDQLSSVLSDGAAFKGFMEANITFPPTYKYDPGTQQFDTSSKQRAPAYTDRILFKYHNHSHVLRRCSTVGSSIDMHQTQQTQCLAYDSVPSIISSDHKPVWALFKVNIRPGIDAIPLAAGLFNREVYVEGMKRRLNNTYTDSSAVCSIQ